MSNKANDPPSISLLAGGAAGMVADAIVHPIDTVRARLQVQSGNNGLVSTYYNIVTKEGWRALYRGFGIVVAFTTPAHALYFLGYEFGKKYIQPNKPADQKGPLVHFSAGLVAECMGALIWTPMDVVKQRLQTQQGTVKYKNSLHAIMTIGKQEGIRGLYRGFFASVATYGPFVGIYFTCYEQNKKFFAKLHKVDTDKLPLYTHLVSGFAAGATGAAITCPLDVVKTRMQVRAAGDTTGYKTTAQAFRTILTQEGPKTFFKGLSARILWIAPGTAITIAAYEQCRRAVIRAFDKLHINAGTNEK
jgi:hypothetical protein